MSKGSNRRGQSAQELKRYRDGWDRIFKRRSKRQLDPSDERTDVYPASDGKGWTIIVQIYNGHWTFSAFQGVTSLSGLGNSAKNATNRAIAAIERKVAECRR